MIEKILDYKYSCQRDIRYTEKVIKTTENSSDNSRLFILQRKVRNCKRKIQQIDRAILEFDDTKDDNILLNLAYSLHIIEQLPPKPHLAKNKAERKKFRKLRKGWATSVMRNFGSNREPHGQVNKKKQSRGTHSSGKIGVYKKGMNLSSEKHRGPKLIYTPMGNKR